MKWIFLLIAGMLEISWAVSLKFTYGFSRLLPSAITVGLMAASFYLLALAVREFLLVPLMQFGQESEFWELPLSE